MSLLAPSRKPIQNNVARRMNSYPQRRDKGRHPIIKEEDLIKKNDLLDPLENDDDIEWKHNPFDVDYVDE